jgi:uncharacterized delta-60 repeat protein
VQCSATAGDGSVDTPFDVSLNERAWGISVLPNGNILLGLASPPYILMLTAKGEIVPEFASEPGGGVIASAVLANNSVFLGGSFGALNNKSHRGIAVIDSSGWPDETFQAGPDAGIQTAEGAQIPSRVFVIAIQRNHDILIGGMFTNVGGLTRTHFARLKSNGDVDREFEPKLDSWILSASLQEDGKILIAGGFSVVNGRPRAGLARLNPDGSLDLTFDPKLNLRSLVTCTAVQADGRILISGSFTNVGGVARESFARLNADGGLDTAFHPRVNANASSIVLQTDGRIFLGGYITNVNGVPCTGIARLNRDGSLDEGFSPQLEPVGSVSVSAIALEQHGSVIISGYFQSIGGIARKNLARLKNGFSVETLEPTKDRIRFVRRGNLPEAQDVAFAVSVNEGQSWSELGWASRTDEGWEMNGMLLPEAGLVRARMRVVGGTRNGSSSLFESIRRFEFTEPVVIVTARLTASGEFYGTFTAAPEKEFVVLESTKIDSAIGDWEPFGRAKEISMGRYEFTDSNPGRRARYFRISSSAVTNLKSLSFEGSSNP